MAMEIDGDCRDRDVRQGQRRQQGLPQGKISYTVEHWATNLLN
jgi:hypothetical protein